MKILRFILFVLAASLADAAVVTRYFTVPASAWVTSTAYSVGDYVSGTDNKNYRCKVAHTSGNTTKPITGGSYATNWDLCDGTTWTLRATLFESGNWSGVISGFNFTGSDSMLALIGPGSYTCGQSLASGVITNAPTVANNLTLHGCDSNGAILYPPNGAWTADMLTWDASSLPVINVTSNIYIVNLANVSTRLLKLTSTSGRNGAILGAGAIGDWCWIQNDTSNSTAGGVASGFARYSNCVISMTGSIFSEACAAATDMVNCRLIGVTGSSGNRQGFRVTSGLKAVQCVVNGFGGEGFATTSTATAQQNHFYRCMFINNGAKGLLFASTASQTVIQSIEKCVITGHSTAGIDGNSGARLTLTGCRLRDNGTNISGSLNSLTTETNYTTDSDDATEYVDAASGDFRIKASAVIAPLGFGISVAPPTVAY